MIISKHSTAMYTLLSPSLLGLLLLFLLLLLLLVTVGWEVEVPCLDQLSVFLLAMPLVKIILLLLNFRLLFNLLFLLPLLLGFLAGLFQMLPLLCALFLITFVPLHFILLVDSLLISWHSNKYNDAGSAKRNNAWYLI